MTIQPLPGLAHSTTRSLWILWFPFFTRVEQHRTAITRVAVDHSSMVVADVAAQTQRCWKELLDAVGCWLVELVP